MFIMSIHTTVWLHRYCTHRAFQFSRPVWQFIIQNLVIKTVPEEIYVLSHHVHHAKSDLPGDPYNARGGFWYCMLAEVNHQRISNDLSEKDYNIAVQLMRHTATRINKYRQYLKWGSVASPFYTVLLWIINWSFWYAIFYFAGGHGLSCAMFSAALLWFIMVRAFNYTGHGKGAIKHKDGIDFDHSNLSVNQVRAGILAGEWHNNHHLYPASARSGFFPYQIDLPWIFIYGMYKLGIVSQYHDSKKEFLRKYAGKIVANHS
jgi:stearoyl-CoA desaturase (delta-9 desaturase)